MYYQDWKHRKEDERYYGVTIPYQDPLTPTPGPQASLTLPATQPLPPIEDVEDFAPEDFVTNAVRSPESERLTGQDALEAWAAQTEAIRQGKAIPTIHRHSNAALREKHLHDVRCPSCGLEFAAEVES
jgi:hypothetical protein